MRSKIYLFFLSAISSLAVHAQVITTFAGTGASGYAGDGDIALHAKFASCAGVAFDGAGNIYIADRDNNVVRKVNTAGVITTFAGRGTAGYIGDGGIATGAMLNNPTAVATDAAGNVYIADYGNNAVRKVAPSGKITTYAGTGDAGFTGDADSANAATLFQPAGLATDEMGNVYIADAGNHAVRMVDADRIIHTIAGTGDIGNTGDGGLAEVARLGTPVSVALDAAGNIYIADVFNNVVKRVQAGTGVISTAAGIGIGGFSGDNGAANMARLNYPSGVSVDPAGNLYIADAGNNRIRVVNTSGIISTYAGSNAAGYAGDGGAPQAAQLNAPRSVAADGWGRLYIADYGNNVIRLVAMPTAVNTMAAANNGMTVYPNPSTGSFTIEVAATAKTTVTVIDMMGRIVDTKVMASANQSSASFDLQNLPAGNYVIKAATTQKTYTAMISIAR